MSAEFDDSLPAAPSGRVNVHWQSNGAGQISANTLDYSDAAQITSGTLPAARLPNPSATTLGGVESIAAVSHQFLTSISTSGVPAQAQPTEADLSLSDITTNDVSITKHGLAPKAPNDATKYLDGTGAYSVPAGSTVGTVTHTGALTSGLPVLGNGAADIIIGTKTGTGDVVFATSPTLITPALGTPASGVLTNATGLPLSTGITGTLSVANGGTGTTSPGIVAGTNVTVSGTWPNQTVNAAGGGSATLTTKGDVLGFDTAANRIPVGADGTVLTADSTAALGVSYKSKPGSVGITIDGGGAVPATGSKGFAQMPYAGTITGWTMLADQSGSAQITVKKSTYSGFPTTASIVASAQPNLSSTQKSTSTTLTGWTTAVSADDILEFNLDSVSTCTRIILKLQITKA